MNNDFFSSLLYGTGVIITQFLVLGAPAIFAAVFHMVVVKLDWFSFLKIPLDFNQTFKGKRLFGENKTLRGVIMMIAFSIGVSYLLYALVKENGPLSDYCLLLFTEYSPAFYGMIYGLGYTLAELPNSFFKRQKGIVTGKRGSVINVIFDQADSPMGCFLLLYPFANYSIGFAFGGVFFFTAFHLAMNYLLFLVGVRKNPV